MPRVSGQVTGLPTVFVCNPLNIEGIRRLGKRDLRESQLNPYVTDVTCFLSSDTLSVDHLDMHNV
ncbi:hypothetical protein [Vibrio coralliilyticus]|uniref:hypothetical protein n=1 Tax=Vibrio coralliilyticus TaxID=190893 RepID=UPI0015D514CD|nr:hypothetical protein [Vibrio coralliilyticus]